MPQVCHRYVVSGTCRYGERCKFEHTRSSATRGRSKPAIQHRKKAPGQNATTHISEFFADYPDFSYDPSKPVTAEFKKLCDYKGWKRDDPKRIEARDKLGDAMTLRFNTIYGTDVDDIGAWQHLCRVLDISPAPDSLKECRNAVRNTHVNLVDLIDNNIQRVRIFPTVKDLSQYTKKYGKFFAKENAHAGGVLKFLLRQILNPGRERVGRGGGGGKGKATDIVEFDDLFQI